MFRVDALRISYSNDLSPSVKREVVLEDVQLVNKDNPLFMYLGPLTSLYIAQMLAGKICQAPPSDQTPSSYLGRCA
jgi:hypothetical protein